ncbi:MULTISPECIES: right-handed parallel beta-helix repeat-containing protein [Sphingobacterium]|uniref:right-handed parallel beta-helix repeat-containing protein n=1 Tax=Sphingobacterium TaxID=28453 RepID=UPI0010480172|nr:MULTISPECIES: right-handed parallel beta-helix repeat-containing protein [Sphingobacterium]MCW2262044.1 hypothetical protein [Sphingobacterium kitahiroshimense]NJI74999.1 right-handed parallel beta-helix repeat-containing protein [Sphingobacterium sp. B16(2022)]TCR13208.1 hypothetical protein EDF67_102622 [Sphingobacterium sp. JUb78]
MLKFSLILLIIFGASLKNNALENRRENGPDLQKYIGKQKKSIDTIDIRTFGVLGNGGDETKKIQEALNKSVGKTLYIPKQKGSFYLSGQLIVPSNLEIICHKEVVFKAKNNLKQDIENFEVLFRFENSKNVVFNGNGAKFFMERKFYKSEFNHLFMINGASNITLKNILAENSGGDGIYVGAYKTRSNYSQNINIINCKSKYNRRQGLSITSVSSFKAENSEFSYSRGSAPCSGVDIEPNSSNSVLKNIHFKNCLAQGNERRGFLVTLSRLNNKSQSVDITFENCRALNNYNGFTSMYFSPTSSGEVRFIKCIAENSANSGFTELSSSGLGAKKIYDSCISKNSSKNSINSNEVNNSGFSIYNVRNRKEKYLGNSQFINCEVISETKGVKCGFFVESGGKVINVDVKNLQFKGGIIKKTNLLIKDNLKSTRSLSVARNDF